MKPPKWPKRITVAWPEFVTPMIADPEIVPLWEPRDRRVYVLAPVRPRKRRARR